MDSSIFVFWFGQEVFSSPERPDRLCGPPSLLFKGYRGCVPGKNGLGVKLTTHLYLVPRLRIGGAIHLLPSMPTLTALITYHHTRSSFEMSAKYRWAGSLKFYLLTRN
jgi:hypothetical protein